MMQDLIEHMGWERFNPRAREGRDVRCKHSFDYLQSFNPRAREGRDTNSAILAMGILSVSIHAPARGATSPPRKPRLRRLVSIHAPARGATPLTIRAAAIP